MHGLVRSLIIPGVALIAAAGGGSAAASASVSSAGTAALSRPAVEVCGAGPARVRPGSMILTCADDGELAQQLDWSSWTRTRATASGIVTWRACSAACEDSKHWDRARANVTLTDPVSEPGKGILFTRLTLHVTGPTPRGFLRNLAFNEAPVPAVSAPPLARGRAPGSALAPSAAPSGTLGYAQIEGFWVDAGGPTASQGGHTDDEIAAAITGAESSFQPGIIQPGVDYCGAGSDRAGWGLWQITCGNSVPAAGTDFQLLDPWNNAEAAVAKYKADVNEGFNGFDPWATFTSGAYTNFLQQTAADRSVTDPGEYVHINPIPSGTPATPAPDPGGTFGPPLPGGGRPGGNLWLRDSSGSQVNTTAGMMPGTSPSVAALSGGGYEVAFQANTGTLWLRNSSGTQINTTAGMDPGTSPSVTALSNGGYEVAFQSNANQLWLRDSSGTQINTTAGMDPGSSPAVAGLSGGGYEVAFQSNAHDLWLRSSSGSQSNTTAGMASGTSPAIAGLTTGSFEVAFQSNANQLWLRTGSGSQSNTTAGMASGTSPAIAGLTTGSFEVAFQANTGTLWLRTGSGSQSNTSAGMAGSSSPVITGLTSGGFEVAFQANTKTLWLRSSSGSQSNTTAGMGSGTSPAIAGLAGGGYEAAFQDNT
jgi:hypothetical protein